MKALKNLVPFVTFIFCCSFLNAQEMTAKKYDNLQWYVVTLIKFEDGKMEDAKRIIRDHFIPTDEASGNPGPVMALDLIFSEWDHIVTFAMQDGLQELDWEVGPREIEWMKALNTQAGGEEMERDHGRVSVLYKGL